MTEPATKDGRAAQAEWEERADGRTVFFDVDLKLPARSTSALPLAWAMSASPGSQ